jgi:hypothetical protein
MPDTQNNTYAQAYGRNIMQLAQQKYSKLYNTVFRKQGVVGKTFFQDQIGQWAMAAKGGRNVQTPNNDPNLARRMGILVDYHDARMLDRGDELRTISDPRSAYTVAAASSIGRKIDDVILSGLLGSAAYGETGSSTVTYGNSVAGTAGYLHLSTLANVKKKLDDADIEPEDRFFVISPTTLSNMLQQTQMTSADYAAVKALVNGEINSFMGFSWIVSTRLGLITGLPAHITASNIAGIAYHKYGLCMAELAQPMVRTDERTDLSYSWQIYYEINLGAVRLEEERVVALNA